MSPSVRPILLIEDNPMDVDLTTQAFHDHNIVNPLIVCRDGEEALRYMADHATAADSRLPILVLLDLRLPKVDGLEVLHHMRQHPVWQQVPIVMLTTSRQNSDVESAYRSGVNSYIVKPVDFAAFAEVARNIKMYWLLTNESPFPEPVIS